MLDNVVEAGGGPNQISAGCRPCRSVADRRMSGARPRARVPRRRLGVPAAHRAGRRASPRPSTRRTSARRSGSSSAPSPGERVMRPDFGAGLDQLRVRAGQPARRSRGSERQVREALVAWEPRIDVEEVRVTPEGAPPVVLLIELRLPRARDQHAREPRLSLLPRGGARRDARPRARATRPSSLRPAARRCARGYVPEWAAGRARRRRRARAGRRARPAGGRPPARAGPGQERAGVPRPARRPARPRAAGARAARARARRGRLRRAHARRHAGRGRRRRRAAPRRSPSRPSARSASRRRVSPRSAACGRGRDQVLRPQRRRAAAARRSRSFDPRACERRRTHLYLAHDTLLALAGPSAVTVAFEVITGSSEYLDLRWEYLDGAVWRPFRDMRPACSNAQAELLDSTDGLQFSSGAYRLEADCAQTSPTTVGGRRRALGARRG